MLIMKLWQLGAGAAQLWRIGKAFRHTLRAACRQRNHVAGINMKWRKKAFSG